MLELNVIYEDNHLIAAIKPPGIPAQGDDTGDLSMVEYVKAYIKEKYNKPGDVYLGLVHRIDRPVGGVMIFARTSKAAARLSAQFQNHTVRKIYVALTEAVPFEKERTLIHYLYKPGDKNIVKASPKEFPGAKRSELKYRILKENGMRALLEVEPITGRQHQIRVQLSAMRCPIRGDVKYGNTTFNPDKSICLFAHKIFFTHPVTQQNMEISAPWPNTDWWQLDT